MYFIGVSKWAELLDSGSYFCVWRNYGIKREVEAKGALQILVYLDLPMYTQILASMYTASS